MSEFDVKMQLLDLSAGDVDRAKLMFGWLNEVASTPEPGPVEGGIVLTEAEVMSSDPEALKALAMMRLAVKQNTPERTKEVQSADETASSR